MWSIGNEVPTQCSSEGYKVAKFLQDICHREDPTRPDTCGMDQVSCVLDNVLRPCSIFQDSIIAHTAMKKLTNACLKSCIRLRNLFYRQFTRYIQIPAERKADANTKTISLLLTTWNTAPGLTFPI